MWDAAVERTDGPPAPALTFQSLHSKRQRSNVGLGIERSSLKTNKQGQGTEGQKIALLGTVAREDPAEGAYLSRGLRRGGREHGATWKKTWGWFQGPGGHVLFP